MSKSIIPEGYTRKAITMPIQEYKRLKKIAVDEGTTVGKLLLAGFRIYEKEINQNEN